MSTPAINGLGRRLAMLREAVSMMLTRTSLTEEQAQALICNAIADRTIGIEVQLGEHTTRPTTKPPGRRYSADDFDLAPDLEPADVDFEKSRPRKPWFLRR